MKISTNDQQLTIKFEGFEIIWGLKSKIVLERDEITDIQWSPEMPDPKNFLGRRCPGTVIPGIFMAGSFTHQKRWEFWCMYLKRPGTLTISSDSNRFKAIRLTADEPKAQTALEWWSQEK